MVGRNRVLSWLVVPAVALGAPLGVPADAYAASGGYDVGGLIDRYRESTWRWQRLMKVELTPHPPFPRTTPEHYRRTFVAAWRRAARRAYRRAHHPPYLAGWRCIHRHEGPWDANTGNGYYGGLQMDVAFQRTYGPDLVRRKGLAHRWLPVEQIWVGVRAHRSGRGFSPWPNAARSCGLL